MTEESVISRALNQTLLTRRSFLKWSAALGGTAAMAGGFDYGLKAVESAAEELDENGEWILAACWHNCGGRCPNYALVKDGVVLRQKTDDTHPDSPDFPQQRACGRGHLQQWQVLGADRIKYPMVRKNWEPGGGSKELRGRDEWVRISWDEALDILASEVTRIRDKYGPESILGRGTDNAMDLSGGVVGAWGSTSTGTWRETGPRIGVTSSGAYNDRMDLRNSNLIVMWGENPTGSSAGNPAYHYMQAKKAGAKFIWVDPYLGQTAQILADEWIPIRPATDHAMLLAMAYIMFTEDDPVNNPLIDWDFVQRCTIGMTKDMLPAGADPEDNYYDYVLGLDAQGNPAPEGHKNYPAKTPEWASKISGVPPKKIHAFTIEVATTKPANILMAWAPARVNNAQHLPTALVALGCLTGNVGYSGAGFGTAAHRSSANPGPSLVTAGGSGVPRVENPVDVSINNNELWDAIMTGEYTAGPGGKTPINIQMIYHAGSATMQTRTGQRKAVDAHRKVEFVVSHAQILTTNAKYSDLVLPVTTEWERWGTILTGNREILIWASQILEPMYECHDDSWIDVELGKRLGLDPEEVMPISLKQQIFNRIAGAQVIKTDGSGYEPLVTITPADLETLGVEGEAQTGRIPILEFKKKGIYQVERYEGDPYGYIALEDFRKDPEANPLRTESGKIEIHCQAIVDRIHEIGFSEIRPIPAYIPPTEGYEDTFADWDNQVKGDYPLQMYTIHYHRRSHTVFDNIPQMRKAFPQEFFMNPIDAKARGIKVGDTVLITSRHAKSLRPVYITNRIMPGVTILPHGAWLQLDDETGIDHAGSDNFLTGDLPDMEGHMGWNSVNVQVEKWTGEPLAPDYQWPLRIPIA